MTYWVARSAWVSSNNRCPRCGNGEISIQGDDCRGFYKQLSNGVQVDLRIDEDIREVVNGIDCPTCGEIEILDDEHLKLHTELLQSKIEMAHITGKLNQAPNTPLTKPKSN